MTRQTPPNVYVVGESGRHFHRTPECWRIRSGQVRKTPATIYEIRLDELTRTSPCRACYPDSPRARTFRPYCREHDSRLPCQHNGGVQVLVPRTWDRGTRALIDPGQVTYATRYVWPERAHWYTPA